MTTVDFLNNTQVGVVGIQHRQHSRFKDPQHHTIFALMKALRVSMDTAKKVSMGTSIFKSIQTSLCLIGMGMSNGGAGHNPVFAKLLSLQK